MRKVSKIADLFEKSRFRVLREQALEHQLVGRRSAQAYVGVAVVDDLVVGLVVDRGKSGVAERGQRIAGDGNLVALADDDECGH